MTGTHISLSDALAEAWDRTQKILFRPFDLQKWLVLGFTAWLAGLGQGGTHFGFNLGGVSDSGTTEAWAAAPATGAPSEIRTTATDAFAAASDWLDWSRWVSWPAEAPFLFALACFGCVFLVALILAVLWVSSRGKFLFLDNVVLDRAEVAEPWRRYGRVANSHFGFQLTFYASFLAVLLAAAALAVTLETKAGLTFDALTPLGIGLLLVVLALVLFCLLAAYLQYFLDGFVVPLMHRYDLGALEAWGRFGELLRAHPWSFLLSGVLLLALLCVAVLVVVAAGLLTCCIGLVLVILPYVGTVVLLPLHVFYRAFTVAMVDQIDPGFFPEVELAPAVPAPAAPSSPGV